MDLAASADALHEPANRIYEYYFLMQLFRRLRRKARLFPGKFDVSRLRGITSLRLFDDRITAYYCGFTGADDYYARAAAANVVDRIAVPALIIHAANDPFIRMQPETLRRIAANPNITYIETADGGHCAFLGERNGDATTDAGPSAKWWSLWGSRREMLVSTRRRRRPVQPRHQFHSAPFRPRADVGQRQHRKRNHHQSHRRPADPHPVLRQNRHASVDKFDVHPVDQQ